MGAFPKQAYTFQHDGLASLVLMHHRTAKRERGLTFPESYLVWGRHALSMLQDVRFRMVHEMLAGSPGGSRFCVGFVFALSLDNQRGHGCVGWQLRHVHG